MKILAALLLFMCVCSGAIATPAQLQLPPAPDVRLLQKIGNTVPLDAVLRDSDGQAVPLRTLFSGERAIVLVPGYYSCSVLCGLVMQGVVEALAQSGLPANSWRIVGFSIDPADTPATARARAADYRAYARFVAGDAQPAPDLRLFTSDAATASRLAQALGYAVEPGRGGHAIAHSAAFIVATPDGRIARYFPGVRYDAGEVRAAVLDATDGQLGSPSERLALLCGHYDPVTGRYSLAVLFWLRVIGCAGALALGFWIWRRREPGANMPPPAP